MFPSSFEYYAPETLDEALSLLGEHGEDAKVLAGGQSLIPLMKLRFASPSMIVDINRIPGLDFIEEDRQAGSLRVGALARNSAIERSDVVASRYPTMAAAAPLISDPIIRNLGTLVGSLCHADPQGDWASVMLALNGEVVARSADGERRIPMTEFIEGPFTPTLAPGELAVEAVVPSPSTSRFFGTYRKLERKVGDFATVGVAVYLGMEGNRVEQAGIALTAVGPLNIKAVDAEEALVGSNLTDDRIAEAARLAAEASQPQTDMRGSAAYKREVVRVYVARALQQAAGAQAA
jgi:carbon-monoxide dehydrogenase medium subunit